MSIMYLVQLRLCLTGADLSQWSHEGADFTLRVASIDLEAGAVLWKGLSLVVGLDIPILPIPLKCHEFI